MNTIKKLKAMPYAQAHVEIEDDGNIIYLFSYVTMTAVIVKRDDGRWLFVTGLYSSTTRRHIGAFMKEYLNDTYQTAKSVYEQGAWYNVDTGEIQSPDEWTNG